MKQMNEPTVSAGKSALLFSLDLPLILWLVVCGDENHDTHNENKIQQRPGLGDLSRRGVCYLWEVTEFIFWKSNVVKGENT